MSFSLMTCCQADNCVRDARWYSKTSLRKTQTVSYTITTLHWDLVLSALPWMGLHQQRLALQYYRVCPSRFLHKVINIYQFSFSIFWVCKAFLSSTCLSFWWKLFQWQVTFEEYHVHDSKWFLKDVKLNTNVLGKLRI